MELCLQNNKVCIYSMEDWKILRQKHRIVGEFLGASQAVPTLPIGLLPEETLLLLKKNFIKVVVYPDLKNIPSGASHDEYKQLQTNLLRAEQEIYKENRKVDLMHIIDTIVDGKMKKGVDVTRESILQKELDRVTVTIDTMIWPIRTDSLNSIKAIPELLNPILEQTSPTKTAVFMDLWEKGYYITSGKKFGGDFLVYTGDPIAFHAIYIIRCIEDTQKEMHMSELVAFGRLGSSVKKKSILASLNNTTVNYVTINWLDM